MNISYQWLKSMIPGLTATPQQVADRLAMLGAPVDEVIDIGGPLRDIVVARVVSAEQHPNADRLRLCTVDAGAGESLQVVCGAPNVKAGAYYPFAPVGASLPGGVTIRRAKIRGSESQGMLCSARELGLGRDHEGILELHGDFAPGESFIESTGLDDARLVVDVTPNRPDLLSHIGIAREIAAAEGLRVELGAVPNEAAAAQLKPVTAESPGTAAASGASVRIDEAELCPHYFAAVIRGVRIGPSPEWLASRLRAIGLRPISNVVDATNYVLHELGQPLHAFDLDRLGSSVVVRKAHRGERLKTLDGVDRALSPEMLVIADETRAVAVAGVMGGADTEVQDDTRNILLECAIFEPRSIRATRRALGLSTDASYRFERGVDPSGLAAALKRALSVIVAAAGGSVDESAAFVGVDVPESPRMSLRLARAEQVLGVRFDAAAVTKYLEPLGFAIDREAAGTVSVQVPGHRRFDVAREEDLIEEIARRHGYDAFPDELRPFRPSSVPTHPLFLLEDRVRSLLVGRGLMESHAAGFAPETDGDVRLLLPLAATESRLRRSLMPGLLRRIESNFARGARSIRLFEIGTVFGASADGPLPHEETRLAIAVTGHRRPPHWSEEASSFDVWDLKAFAGDVARLLGLELHETARSPFIDPGLSFRLAAAHDEAVGWAGRVRDGLVDAPAWADEVWVLEVDLRPSAAAAAVRHADLPQHPAIERDLALLVGTDRPAADVADTIRRAGGALLESAEPFDVYSGAGVPEHQRSIAYRLRFRAADRTLTDAEVDDIVRRILAQLNEHIGVQQRA